MALSTHIETAGAPSPAGLLLKPFDSQAVVLPNNVGDYWGNSVENFFSIFNDDGSGVLSIIGPDSTLTNRYQNSSLLEMFGSYWVPNGTLKNTSQYVGFNISTQTYQFYTPPYFSTGAQLVITYQDNGETAFVPYSILFVGRGTDVCLGANAGNGIASVTGGAYDTGSGTQSVYIGSGAGENNTYTSSNNAVGNVIVGWNAAESATLISESVVIGSNASMPNGSDNVLIGFDCSINSTNALSSSYNVLIGADVSGAGGSYIDFGNSNVLIGYSVFGGGSDNTIIGASASLDSTSDLGSTTGNVLIGAGVTTNITGNNNIVIGQGAGTSLAAGNGNIVIGSAANALSSSATASLNIANYIFGTGLTGSGTSLSPTTAAIGIGVISPSATLHVVGTGLFTGQLNYAFINNNTSSTSSGAPGQTPVAVTVGASPFTFSNPVGYDIVVIVSGGAGLTETFNGTTIASGISGTVHSYILRGGPTSTSSPDVLKITYTTAPTMYYYPL